MKILILLTAILALAACSTPRTTLKNEKTGQVVTCGGGKAGSLAGGVIGYNIQKSNDEDCVAEHKARGFKAVETAPDTTGTK